ncbi:MAG: DUF4864 domain-containing protein [Chthoniobacterales bacterium]
MSGLVKISLLIFFFAICSAAFLVTHHLRARLQVPAPRELFAIVNQQLLAFRADDFQGAYRQAATGVQHKFTLPQFEKMVRQSYPEMTRAYRVEFGLVEVEGGSALVQVFFFAENGAVRSFMYSLIEEDDSWKINGVEELKNYRRNQSLAGSHA